MPAPLTITRPNFLDTDPGVNAPRFNSVTILSATVPDATPGSEGVIRLAGDLTGGASAPVLINTGVTAGTYAASALKVATFTVDAKGRFTAVSERDLPLPDAADNAKGLIQLAGDLTGTAAAPVLVNTAVTAATYATADQALETVADPAALAALVVAAGDVGKRIVRVTSTGFYYLATTAGTGADKWTQQTPVSNGVFSIGTWTVDAKGRLTAAGQRSLIIPEASASVPGRIQLAGDLTGTAASPQLTATGVTAGSYGSSTTSVQLTVDAKGRITGIGQVNIPAPTGASSAFVAFDGSSTASFRAGLAYNRASNVVTVTASAHGFRVGDRVGVDFTSGTGVTDGLYAVTSVPDANTFTFAHTGVNTGGNLTLEIFATRNTFNVHSVVKDRRTANGSYWLNYLNALNNDTHLVTGTADMSNGVTVVMLNATAGVRAQDTRGCSIYCYEPTVGATNPPNVSVVIHGG